MLFFLGPMLDRFKKLKLRALEFALLVFVIPLVVADLPRFASVFVCNSESDRVTENKVRQMQKVKSCRPADADG